MIRPIGPRLLVKPDVITNTTKSGIITSTSKEENLSNMGEVLSIGKDVECVEAGERVMYGQYAGSSVEIDGAKYIMIHIDDIMGVL